MLFCSILGNYFRRFDKTYGTCDAFTCDVERCAMVYGTSYERKAEGECHGFFKIQCLAGNVPLIVIERKDSVKLS